VALDLVRREVEEGMGNVIGKWKWVWGKGKSVIGGKLAGSGGWKEVELGRKVEESKREREEIERIVRLFEREAGE